MSGHCKKTTRFSINLFNPYKALAVVFVSFAPEHKAHTKRIGRMMRDRLKKYVEAGTFESSGWGTSFHVQAKDMKAFKADYAAAKKEAQALHRVFMKALGPSKPKVQRVA